MSHQTIHPSSQMSGVIEVPSDKSISHRAVILGALANGVSTVDHFLTGEDCLRTMEAFRAMGVSIEQHGTSLQIKGKGLHLKPPIQPIDCGNSGTTTRLLMGVLTGQPFEVTLFGDESLSKRPMKRVMDPLTKMGARFYKKEGEGFPSQLPLKMNGTTNVQAIQYQLPMASAQVKTAILLAGLYAKGTTSVSEPTVSRDHSERMFKACGVSVTQTGTTVSITGPCELHAFSIDVPGDISSAAFFIVAGLLGATSNEGLLIRGVNTNPTRTGILDVVRAMGGKLFLENERIQGGEPVADIRVYQSKLKATMISGSLIPRLIDEIPILAVLATQATGTTVVANAEELRVKESDRIATVCAELTKMGAHIEETTDGLLIKGPTPLHGALTQSYGDHRLAMSLAIAGRFASSPTEIHDIDCIQTSFPNFWNLYEKVSA